MLNRPQWVLCVKIKYWLDFNQSKTLQVRSRTLLRITSFKNMFGGKFLYETFNNFLGKLQ